MDRSQILAAARQAVVHDRAAAHGAAEVSFAAIAGGWNWWLGLRAGPAGINRSGGAIEGGQGPAGLRPGALTAVDVGAMMVIFKLARAAGNPGHGDNWVDIAGYAACTGELALAGGQSVAPNSGAAPVVPCPGDRADGAPVTGLVPATLPAWLGAVVQRADGGVAVSAAESAAPRKPAPRRVARLTCQTRWTAERLAVVAQMVRDGKSNAEIATAFGATVKAVVNRVYRLRQTGALPGLAPEPRGVVPAANLGAGPAGINRSGGAIESGQGPARQAPARRPVPPASAAPAAMPERIAAHPPLDFWTPERDLELAERLGRGEKLVDIAGDFGIEVLKCRSRFRALSKPLRDAHDRLPIEAMPKLLAGLRARLGLAQPEAVVS